MHKTTKRFFWWLAAGFFINTTITTHAQTVIGMGTENPNPHAVLELVPKNGNQGFLAPRLSTSQRTAVSFTNSLTRTDNGLLVFDTEEGQFFYWYEGEWRKNGPADGTTTGTSRDFAVWYAGRTVPNDIDAREGDFYIDESTGDVYKFSGGSFGILGKLGAADGTIAEAARQNLSEVLDQGNDAGTKRITNLGSPVAGSDAVTMDYVTEQISNLPAGDPPPLETVLERSNSANGNQIKSLANPTEEQDAATKAYVDREIGAIPVITSVNIPPSLDKVLEKGNDASSARIVNLSDPEESQDAATKAYVDNRIASPVAVLPKGHILVGSNTGTPKPVTVSGHVTMDADGNVTIGNNVVTRDRINANVAGFGLAQNNDGSLEVALEGDVVTRNDALQVVGLQGRPVSKNPPEIGQMLVWDGNEWIPTNPATVGPGGGSTTNGERQNGLLNTTEPSEDKRQVGMLWIDSSGDGKIKVWNGSEWRTLLSGD